MNVVVNGDRRHLDERATIAQLIADLGRNPEGRGIAVAVNGEVVPRGAWREHDLAENDKVELLEAVQGG